MPLVIFAYQNNRPSMMENGGRHGEHCDGIYGSTLSVATFAGYVLLPYRIAVIVFSGLKH